MSKYIPQKPTTMRLKGFWRDRKGDGQRFRYKLKDYYWQIHWACQRAWNGYDYLDVCSSGFRLCERLQAQLKEFYKYHHELVDDPEIDEATLKIIDLLEYGVEEDYSYKTLFPDAPDCEVDCGKWGTVKLPEYTKEQYIAAEQHTNEKLLEAFTLIGKHIRGLWY